MYESEAECVRDLIRSVNEVARQATVTQMPIPYELAKAICRAEDEAAAVCETLEIWTKHPDPPPVSSAETVSPNQESK